MPDGAIRLVGRTTRVHRAEWGDRKSTRLNSSHGYISYAVFCLKNKTRRRGSGRRGPPAGAALAHPIIVGISATLPVAYITDMTTTPPQITMFASTETTIWPTTL